MAVELLPEIFVRLVRQWYKAGIVKGETIISDASLVAANASINSLIVGEDNSDLQKRELKAYEIMILEKKRKIN